MTLIPATDAATATMIRCSVYGSAGRGTRVTMTAIPSGSYKVSVYNWEDNSSAHVLPRRSRAHRRDERRERPGWDLEAARPVRPWT